MVLNSVASASGQRAPHVRCITHPQSLRIWALIEQISKDMCAKLHAFQPMLLRIWWLSIWQPPTKPEKSWHPLRIYACLTGTKRFDPHVLVRSLSPPSLTFGHAMAHLYGFFAEVTMNSSMEIVSRSASSSERLARVHSLSRFHEKCEQNCMHGKLCR